MNTFDGEIWVTFIVRWMFFMSLSFLDCFIFQKRKKMNVKKLNTTADKSLDKSGCKKFHPNAFERQSRETHPDYQGGLMLLWGGPFVESF